MLRGVWNKAYVDASSLVVIFVVVATVRASLRVELAARRDDHVEVTGVREGERLVEVGSADPLVGALADFTLPHVRALAVAVAEEGDGAVGSRCELEGAEAKEDGGDKVDHGCKMLSEDELGDCRSG